MAHAAPNESRDSIGELSGNAARAAVSLTALTRHDDFLLELGEVLDGRASVHPAESIDAALDHVSSERGGQILAIDARDMSELRADVERALEQTPHAVILVFADAGAEKSVAAAVKGTTVFAVLPLPIEPDKTTAVLNAAITDALQQTTPSRAAATQPERRVLLQNRAPPSPAAPALGAEAGSGGSRKPLVILAGAAALAVAAIAVGVFLFRRHAAESLPAASGHVPTRPIPAQRPAAAVLPGPAVDTSIVQGRVEDLLVKASRAMFARHFTAPRGANALVYYRSVLAVDPTNGEARDGLRRVSHVLISRFQDAIAHGHTNAAALALATLRLAEPTNPHLGPFGIALSSALVNQALAGGHLSAVSPLIAQAAHSGVPAAQIMAWQNQLASLQNKQQARTIAQQIIRRISANRLTGAASAASALARLRVLAPSASATESATHALLSALLRQARQAGIAGRTDAENQWLAAARANGATPQALTAVRQQVTAQHARTQHAQIKQLLAMARARLAAGVLTPPARDSAAHYLTLISQAHLGPKASAAAQRLRQDLAKALVARAEAAAQDGQRAAAQADLGAAQRWGATAAALQAAAHILDAPPKPTDAQLADVARNLRRTHYVAPGYPQQALSERIAGEVTVQYIVDQRGRTRALQVIQASPPDVFNRAALDAIRRWRYAPPRFRGTPVEVPVRTMIRFVLPN